MHLMYVGHAANTTDQLPKLLCMPNQQIAISTKFLAKRKKIVTRMKSMTQVKINEDV